MDILKFVDHNAVEHLQEERNLNHSTIVEIMRLTFDLKYQQGKKMLVTDASSIFHIEAEEDMNDEIPLNFTHLNTVHIYHNYKHLRSTLYKHKPKYQVQIITKPKRGYPSKYTNTNQKVIIKTLKTTKQSINYNSTPMEMAKIETA